MLFVVVPISFVKTAIAYSDRIYTLQSVNVHDRTVLLGP